MDLLCRLTGIPVSKSRGFTKDGNIWRGFPDDAKANPCGGGGECDEVENEKMEDEEAERQEAMRC